MFIGCLFFVGCREEKRHSDEKITNTEDTLFRDTLFIKKDNTITFFDCDFKVKSPYALVQYDDKTYAIIKKDSYSGEVYLTWYHTDESGHDFTNLKEYVKKYNDSCEAKDWLKHFLIGQDKFNYKEIK